MRVSPSPCRNATPCGYFIKTNLRECFASPPELTKAEAVAGLGLIAGATAEIFAMLGTAAFLGWTTEFFMGATLRGIDA